MGYPLAQGKMASGSGTKDPDLDPAVGPRSPNHNSGTGKKYGNGAIKGRNVHEKRVGLKVVQGQP